MPALVTHVENGRYSLNRVRQNMIGCYSNMNKNDLDVAFSSKSNDWETPLDFFNGLNSIYDFTLDPCATAETTKCPKFFTERENGLLQSWRGERVFVNPPYSNIGAWAEKSYREYMRENVTVVMLIPARTDTKYFQKHCMEATSLGFIQGRLKFDNRTLPTWMADGSHKKSPAPYPSVLVIFDPMERGTPQTLKRFSQKGLLI